MSPRVLPQALTYRDEAVDRFGRQRSNDAESP
jgi:hypothetical protein